MSRSATSPERCSSSCSASWSTCSRHPDFERPSLATDQKRVVFKLCLLMHQVHTGRAPSYLRSCVTASADMTSRPRLRSASSQRYERQRTCLKLGERSFFCAGPRAWNSLPSPLHELTDNGTFERHLKLFFFSKHTSNSFRYIC